MSAFFSSRIYFRVCSRCYNGNFNISLACLRLKVRPNIDLTNYQRCYHIDRFSVPLGVWLVIASCGSPIHVEVPTLCTLAKEGNDYSILVCGSEQKFARPSFNTSRIEVGPHGIPRAVVTLTLTILPCGIVWKPGDDSTIRQVTARSEIEFL